MHHLDASQNPINQQDWLKSIKGHWSLMRFHHGGDTVPFSDDANRAIPSLQHLHSHWTKSKHESAAVASPGVRLGPNPRLSDVNLCYIE